MPFARAVAPRVVVSIGQSTPRPGPGMAVAVSTSIHDRHDSDGTTGKRTAMPVGPGEVAALRASVTKGYGRATEPGTKLWQRRDVTDQPLESYMCAYETVSDVFERMDHAEDVYGRGAPTTADFAVRKITVNRHSQIR